MSDNTFKEKLELKKSLGAKKKYSSLPGKKKYVSVPMDSFKATHFELFQKTCPTHKVESDINLLTNLVLSDEEDMSHLELVKKDFANGVLSPFADDLLDCLAENSKLIADICG